MFQFNTSIYFHKIEQTINFNAIENSCKIYFKYLKKKDLNICSKVMYNNFE